MQTFQCYHEYWPAANILELLWQFTAHSETFASGNYYKTCRHTETEVVGAKDATLEEEGYTGDTKCKACGETVAQGTTIPKLNPPATVEPAPTGDVLNVALAVSVAMLILASVIVSEKRKIHE